MKMVNGAIILIFALSAASTSRGDIYRHIDGEGTVSFTDSPGDSSYTLIMRDRHQQATSKLSREINPLQRARSANPDNRPPGGESSLSGELPLQGVVTSTTGLRNDPFNGRLTHHNGMDIAAPSGTPVKPVAPGRVIFSGWRSGYGNMVILEHDDGMFTIYAHHSVNRVSEGNVVDRSNVIALSGSTGRSTGPHLHFEAWRVGENITDSFLPPTVSLDKPRIIASAPVKRFLQPDGTILFTNLR